MYQINKILFDCNDALYIQLKEKFLNEKGTPEVHDIPFLEKNYGEVILEDTITFASRFSNLKEYLLSAGMSSFFFFFFFGSTYLRYIIASLAIAISLLRGL